MNGLLEAVIVLQECGRVAGQQVEENICLLKCSSAET